MMLKAWILGVLPQRWVSRQLGCLVRQEFPAWFLTPIIHIFAWAFGIDLTEAAQEPRAYTNFQAFFARHLKEGSRNTTYSSSDVLSPCDGYWGAGGTIREGQVFQAKGRDYSLANMLGDALLASKYEGGDFQTFYLSPKNYHRFHSMGEWEVDGVRYLPGRLWPVAPSFLQHVDSLFASNERVVASGVRAGKGITIVPVGAFNVGSVTLSFDRMSTNDGRSGAYERVFDESIQLKAGQEWGYFGFGSTLVCFFEKGCLEIERRSEGTPVQVGEVIGRYLD